MGGVAAGAAGAVVCPGCAIVAGIGVAVYADTKYRQYVTYTMVGPKGLIYVGRTSGYGSPQAIATRRGYGHGVRRARGFSAPIADRFSSGDFGRRGIRGREQQMIDFHGGVGDPRVDNLIRGVSRINLRGRSYHDAANSLFGEIHPYTGAF